MTNDEIAERIADQMNKVIEGITGPTTEAVGERLAHRRTLPTNARSYAYRISLGRVLD